jgi:hypothetical protein
MHVESDRLLGRPIFFSADKLAGGPNGMSPRHKPGRRDSSHEPDTAPAARQPMAAPARRPVLLDSARPFQHRSRFNGQLLISIAPTARDRTPNTSFNLTINAPPTSTHPTLDANSALSVGQGQTALITSSNLHVTDIGLNPWQIIYNVTGDATHGQILVGGINVVQSFTQQQVDFDLIWYQNTDNVSGSDNLTFSVADSARGTIGQTTLGINVIPKNTPRPIVRRPTASDTILHRGINRTHANARIGNLANSRDVVFRSGRPLDVDQR